MELSTVVVMKNKKSLLVITLWGFCIFFFFLRKKAFGWCFSWAAVQLGTAFKLYTCLFNNWLSFACKIYGYCACLCSWNEWEIINIKLKCAVEWWHAKKHRSQKKMIKKHQRKMPPKFRQRHYKAWFVLSSERIQSQPFPLSLQKKNSMCIKLLPFCTEPKGEDTDSKMRYASNCASCVTPGEGATAFS